MKGNIKRERCFSITIINMCLFAIEILSHRHFQMYLMSYTLTNYNKMDGSHLEKKILLQSLKSIRNLMLYNI